MTFLPSISRTPGILEPFSVLRGGLKNQNSTVYFLQMYIRFTRSHAMPWLKIKYKDPTYLHCWWNESIIDRAPLLLCCRKCEKQLTIQVKLGKVDYHLKDDFTQNITCPRKTDQMWQHRNIHKVNPLFLKKLLWRVFPSMSHRIRKCWMFQVIDITLF